MVKTYRTTDELAYIIGILHTLKSKGDLVEIGIYNGGSAKVIRENSDGILYLFDTFGGIMSEQILDYEKENYKAGDYRCSLNEVKEYLKNYKDIIYHEGDIIKTKNEVEDKKFKFIHIDLDIYIPLKDCLSFFYERLSDGGVLLVSNYDDNHLGIKKVVNEFLKPFKKYSRFACYQK